MIPVDARLVTGRVEVVGGDTRSHERADLAQDLARGRAGAANEPSRGAERTYSDDERHVA